MIEFSGVENLDLMVNEFPVFGPLLLCYASLFFELCDFTNH